MFQHKLIMLGIFAFCVIVFCEERYRCCPPERWEGNIRSTFIMSSNGSLSLMVGDSNFSYDATLHRVSMRSEYSDEKGNLISSSRVLMDYKTGIRYEVTLDKCKGSVIGKINDSCIPVSAFSTMLYRNVKHGIRDPDVFNIPASCDKWNSTVNIPPIGRRFAHI